MEDKSKNYIELIMNFSNTNSLKIRILSIKKVRFTLLQLYIFFNGFVYFEPAIAEYIFILLFISYFIDYKNTFNVFHLIVSLSLLTTSIIPYLVSNLVFSNSNIKFLIIDVYLSVMFLFELDIFQKCNTEFDDIIKPWIYAAVINIVIYFIALFLNIKTIFNTDVIRFDWRLTGFFKDPNVCGPFLLVPALYFFDKVLIKFKIKDIILFTFFFIGVILSMSRAAWLNAFVALSLLFLFKKLSFIRKLKLLILGLIICIPLFIYIYNFATTKYSNIIELLILRIDLQEYDTERFESHHNVLKMITISPIIGVGTGNYINFSEIEAHNTFYRIIGERGLLFGLITLIIFLIPLFKSYRKKDTLLLSILLGMYVNSYFIDSFHWRFIWILFAYSFTKTRNYLQK